MSSYTAKQAAEWLARTCELWSELQNEGHTHEANALQQLTDHIFEISLERFGNNYVEALEIISQKAKRKAASARKARSH